MGRSDFLRKVGNFGVARAPTCLVANDAHAHTSDAILRYAVDERKLPLLALAPIVLLVRAQKVVLAGLESY